MHYLGHTDLLVTEGTCDLLLDVGMTWQDPRPESTDELCLTSGEPRPLPALKMERVQND